MPTSRNGVRAPSTTFVNTRETGRARRGGPCTAMPDLRTQTVETVCVAEGSKRESKRPSGRSLQTNPGDLERILNGSLCKARFQDSQIQDWPKATTFLGYDEVRAVNPCLISAGGAGSIASFARRTAISSRKTGAFRTATDVSRRRWTWEVAWRTESRSRVELCAWASETGWAAWATPPDAVQAAPTAQSTYLWRCSERE